MLHLVVVSSTMTLQILQVLVLNLGLPWAVAARQKDPLGEEWQPLPEAESVQADIIATLEKVGAVDDMLASLHDVSSRIHASTPKLRSVSLRPYVSGILDSHEPSQLKLAASASLIEL